MNKFLLQSLCRVMIRSVEKVNYRKQSKCKCGNFLPYGLTISGAVAASMPFYMCVNCEK
ncbi:hypothetical protein Ah1_00192 [Aeromonas phage Ah1]|uniref:Uncharacterized protein n=1 Tax=Aeromonas phage Ah1 TaxID=2053701 RepID=A0A2H4YEX0_9CAUD|nr:hypothetical protein KNT77_gp324 [Aeromonas phage Ah1]AUE22712.1 hypothetical protein Ah1_00192 [Aeromonas phage Ah1]